MHTLPWLADLTLKHAGLTHEQVERRLEDARDVTATVPSR